MDELDLTNAAALVGLRTSEIGVAVLDHDSVIVDVNDRWRLFSADSDRNLDASYSVGARFLDTCDRLDVGHPTTAAAIRAALAGNLDATAVVDVSWRPPDHDRWCDITVSARINEAGEPFGVTLTLTDPRGHDLARPNVEPLSDIDEGEAWAMVESSPDGMILADENGVIALVNSQIEKLFGYDRANLLGLTIEVLIPERNRQIHTAHRTRYRAKPKARAMGTDLDLYGRRQNGTEFPVEVSLSPVTTTRGLRVVATVRDVTDKTAAQAYSHAVLHTIDAAHEGVFMFTADTLEFQYVNRGAESQLGYTREELLTMSPLHIAPDLSEASLGQLLEPLLDGQTDSVTFDTTHRRKNGTDIPVEIILEYPPPHAPGQPRMFVALVRNITDRVEAETAIRNNETALRLLEDRERLARDLHDVVIQRLFAAGIGLQAIHSQVQDKRAAQRVADTVAQMDRTIAELRSAIFEISTPTNQSTTAKVDKIIDQAALQLPARPSLSIDGNPELIPAGVVEQLLPTLTEALSNVARHAQAANVEVALRVGPELVTLTVTDDGVGVDPSAPRGNGLDNLQTRAQQVDGTLTINPGSQGGTTLNWTAPI